MIAWSSSAPSAGTGMPNARKHTANPAAFTSHSTSDHATTPAKRPGRRSTSSPTISPSASRARRSARRAGSTPWVTLLKKESHGVGRCTTARATSSAAPKTIAAPLATRLTDVPPMTASRGNDGAAIASAIMATITRSTPMEAKAVEKRTGSCCLATYARANSPARAGSRLLAMKPTAVACHSGRRGRRVSSPARSINCHRQVRIGKVAVMRATLASNSHGSAWLACVSTSRGLTSCSVQTSSATETARPMSQAQRVARLLAGLDGEGNEVADFFDEGAQALARCRAGFLAQLLGALLGALAAIDQGADVHDLGLRSDRPPGGGRRGCGRPGGVRRGRRSRDLACRSEEIGERSGADPTGHQPRVGHPGADDVRRFGNRFVAGRSPGGRGGGGERRDGYHAGGAGGQGRDGAGNLLKLRRERGLIRSRRAAEDVARAAQLRGERGRVRDGGPAHHGVAGAGGEGGHLFGERATARTRQGPERARQRVRAQLALRAAGRALQRVGHLL